MFPLKSNFAAGFPLAMLEASWLRTVANILNDIEGVGCHIEKTYGGEGMGWKIIVDTDPADLVYPFKVTDNGGGSVSIQGGSWTRNGITVTLADTTLTGVGADDYVMLKLGSGSLDPSFYPESLTVSAQATIEADGLDTTGAGYNIYCVLGKFTAGVWVQYWKGGHIDDVVLRPDGDKLDTTGRSTIVRNPESGLNAGELQVGDVHSVKASAFSVPFFVSDDSTPIQGDMRYASVDGRDGDPPFNSSLQIVGDATGTAYIQVSGFRTAVAPADPFATDTYTHHFCMRETDGTYTSTKWYDFDTFIDALKSDLLNDSTFLESLSTSVFSYFYDWYDALDTAEKKFWEKGADHTVNYGSKIGNSLKTEVINLDSQLLLAVSGESSATSLDWTNLKLFGAWFTDTSFKSPLFIDGDNNNGITLANWFGGGIAIGATIQEIEIQDALPSDKILVIRA